ncbi:amidase [uncultured Brevundimonas sp.]|uniref:amidase n=1 Tax=uncultured Brevundimonas sp. TaxID=213418 RepID=UPI0030EECDCB
MLISLLLAAASCAPKDMVSASLISPLTVVTGPATVLSPLTAMSGSDLATAIRNGDVTSEAVVEAYLARIDAYDDAGPMIQSVISLNPDSLSEARMLDIEAGEGRFRGRLHGVPVLVKDNIETRELPTTAGSLALAENRTGRDAPIIARLRAEGAIILGKTNLSEWANYRSSRSISGWSGVGGLTRNPHSLDRSPCGSSAGSAAAVAARFAPLALGTETNGSITCPAAMNGIVGFKPTVGLMSRTNIVPLSPRQDSAGPMTQTVRDAALMLTVMAGTDLNDPATVNPNNQYRDYVEGLDAGIDGMRIGVFRWAEGDNAAVSAAFNEALKVLTDQGAVLVDIREFEPDPVMFVSGDTVLRVEFKQALNAYLADSASGVEVRSLPELIAYNDAHADRELALFDQSILIQAEQSAGLDDPEYIANASAITEAARAKGIDLLLREHNVQVLVMPTTRAASPVDIAFTSRPVGGPVGAGWLAAMAGYPTLTVPMGDYMTLPLGLMIVGTAWDDARVLTVGHAYQIHSNKTLAPGYANGPLATPGNAAAILPDVAR